MIGPTMPEDWEAITVLVDYAPPENGEAFSAWCARYDFTPLNSPRRAWCGQFSCYFRGAIGVAQTRSGEQFLVYAGDFAEGAAGA